MVIEDYKENYGQGYISLWRSIQKHWIFENDKWLKWWVIMLFEVNHSPKKVSIGYEVIEVKTGQSIKSLRTWARLLNTDTKQLIKFFKMLEKDGMISKKTIGKGKRTTTLINISNYSQYQAKMETQRHTQQHTPKPHNDPTNNNGNNYNNEINEDDAPCLEFNPKNPNTEQKMRMMWHKKFDSYIWDGETDRPAMSSIKKKLIGLVKKKRNLARSENVDEQWVLNAWAYILKYMPEFWQTKLLKSINENFNTISAEVKKADEAEKAEHRRALL